MRVLAAALRALPVTFAIYVVEALVAIVSVSGLGVELLADPRATFDSAAGRAVWLDRAWDLLPVLRVAGRQSLLAALLLLLVSPWLQMAWLHALSTPVRLSRALQHGARLYWRALATSAWVLVLGALALLPFGAALWATDALLSASARARAHDLALIAIAGPCALVLCLLLAAHDLARACALDAGALRSAGFGIRRALRPRVLSAAVGFGLAGWCLRAVHVWVAYQGAALGTLTSTALLQAACLGVLFVRSAWLAFALTCAESSSASGDPA